MANIEGMYGLIVGDETGAGAGVIVLETQRLFGGDSAMAYKGEYTVAGDRVTGKALTWQYVPGIEVTTVFNLPGHTTLEIGFDVHWTDDDQLAGHVWPLSQEMQRLPIVLRRIADLP